MAVVQRLAAKDTGSTNPFGENKDTSGIEAKFKAREDVHGVSMNEHMYRHRQHKLEHVHTWWRCHIDSSARLVRVIGELGVRATPDDFDFDEIPADIECQV